MPLCRVADRNGNPEFALFREGQFCPLRELTDDAPINADIFSRGPDWLASLPEPEANQWRSAPKRMLPPTPSPQKLFCIGLNYIEHANETNAQIPDQPVVFNKVASAMIGHGDSIVLPKVSEKVDFEGELVVVIGKAGRHISKSAAMDHVFGVTCGNDVSARDWQKGVPQKQWLLGKTFDTFAPLGPCIATRREIPDPGNLKIETLVNGEVMQSSTTKHLIFDIPTLIEHISQIVTFQPGDLIFTGTPPGVGVARTPPRFLQADDVCTVRIEQIGELTNTCVAES